VILGEIISASVRDTGATTEHRAELGGSQILWKALLAGEIDVYPEYTGTLSQELLGHEHIRTHEQLEKTLKDRGIGISGNLGFNNTYALGMPAERAARLGIKTISDLAKHPDRNQFRFGLSDEFLERLDGWPGLQARYGLPEKHVRGLDHNLAYRAIQSGGVDLTDVYTTDAEIRYYNLVALEDDRGHFPAYHGLLLYRLDLEQRAPKAIPALLRLEERIPTATMMELNARVKIDRVSEVQAAVEFVRQALQIEAPLPKDASGSQWQRRIDRLVQRTGEHLFLVFFSLALAIIVAIPLGVWAYCRPRIGHTLLAIAGVIQTIPSLAVLVFMIPLLGLGAWPAIAALFLYSLLPIIRGTYTGLQQIPSHLAEAALVLGLPPSARLRLVDLPLASPSILSGIKTAAVINVGTATIGALIGAGGYGQPILTGIRLDNIGLILQGAVPAAVMAIVVQSGFDFLERFVIPKGLRLKTGT
jgi:osmoprotectant transport system permease protein